MTLKSRAEVQSDQRVRDTRIARNVSRFGIFAILLVGDVFDVCCFNSWLRALLPLSGSRITT